MQALGQQGRHAQRNAGLTHMHACTCWQVDDAFRCSDREAVEMAAHLLRCDGLFVGSSAAVNCAGAVKAARALGPGHTIVTVRAGCDNNSLHNN
jgi:cysteine synthase